jgi:3-oxoacyl-[acyl-carrier protein] reductase
VFGGTGHVGSAVVAELAARGVDTVITHFGDAPAPDGALALDLRDAGAIRRAIASIDPAPDVFIHCAAVAGSLPIAEVTDELWDRAHAVNVRSAHVALRELVPRLPGGGDVVLCAALDGIHPVPAPAHFAASQGALAGLTRGLARELGRAGVRINLVVLGVLDGGIASDLRPELRSDYTKYSALRRTGTAREAAKVIARVALDNRWMTGSLVDATGGL